MRQRRLLFTFGILGVLALLESVLIGLATGPASSEGHWPGPLDYVRMYPWPAVATFTVIGGVITVWTVVASREQPPKIVLPHGCL